MKKRRIVVIMVVVLMVLTMLPLTASAEVTFSNIASMGTVRGYYPAAAALDSNRILVMGGMPTSTTDTATAEIYTISSNTWSNAAAMPINRRWNMLNAAVLDDGRVLIAGGDLYGDGATGLSNVDIYNPSTNTWDTSGGEDPHNPGVYSAAYLPGNVQLAWPTATTMDDGKVLIAGGRIGGTPQRRCWIFNPSDKSFVSIADMNYTHSAHAATLLNDGKVLVTGGEGASSRTKKAEIYDPDTNTWTTIPDFPVVSGTDGKVGMVLVTLEDGRVMMMGGNSGAMGSDEADSQTSYYYPESNTWEEGPDMASFSKSRAAYAMVGGVVYVFGGGDDSSSYYNTCFKVEFDEPTLETVSGLEVSPGTLSPVYNQDTIFYDVATQPNSQVTIDVTPTSSEGTIKVNGVSTVSGSARTVSLSVGANSIYVDVKDPDSLVRRYTIDVQREGSPPSTKTVLEDCAPTKLLGVNGLNISSPSTATPGVGTLTVTTADADSNFDDILYTPASGYSGTFTVNYTTDTGAKSIDVTVTQTHDVRFEDSDNSEIETRTIVDGQPISSDGGAVSDPSAPAHYSFANWDSAQAGDDYSSAAAASYVPTGDTTFTADYAIDQHTITTTENGGSTVPSLTRDYNGTINEGDVGTTTKGGYDFGGWYEDDITFNTAVTFPHTVTADDVWYAKWNPIVYNITYDLDGGSNDLSNPSSYTIETPTITFADASKVSYDFGGWYTDSGRTAGNEITQIAQGSTGAVDVWAKWTPTPYAITYNLDGGSNDLSNPPSYTIETPTITFADASKASYDFGGWYTDSGCTAGNEITQIAQGSAGVVDVWAKWTPTPYAVTYNLDGGSNDLSNPPSYTIETPTITFADASKASYDFGGWYTDSGCTAGNEITQIAQGSTGAVDVWAKWTPTQYAITYNLDGGTNNADNPAEYNIESAVILLAEPAKDGYVFEGWYTTDVFTSGSEITEIPAGSSGNVEVWVKWTEVVEGHQYLRVTGSVSTEGGQGQQGIAVTLNSNPRTVYTDSSGSFVFENVELVDHTLVIKNSAGTVIGEYDLDFTPGSKTKVVINGVVVDVTYTENTVAIEIGITINETGTATTLDDVTAISNPETGNEGRNVFSLMLWIAIGAAVVVLMTGAWFVVIKKQNRSEA